jgi:low affinity Fe/Cu permease
MARHHEAFRQIARRVSHVIGTPGAFAIALVAVFVWALSGPIFGFSDTWQLVINTSTTIVTFLVVFLIQNTQNHDAKAIHLKLDELIRAINAARTGMVDLESLPDEDLDRLEREFHRLRLGLQADGQGLALKTSPALADDPAAAADRTPVREPRPVKGRTLLRHKPASNPSETSGTRRPKSAIRRRRHAH